VHASGSPPPVIFLVIDRHALPFFRQVPGRRQPSEGRLDEEWTIKDEDIVAKCG